MDQFKIEVLNETKQEAKIENYLYIGSDNSCGLSIAHQSVERKHALIEQKEDKIFIKDLRSLSGVYVNGARIVEARLNDGDMIRLGDIELIANDLKIVKPKFRHLDPINSLKTQKSKAEPICGPTRS